MTSRIHDGALTQRGFTLIEVLAALIIVALGMLAVIQAVSQTLNNANYLREKTIAHWVAMNQLTTVRLSNTAPAGGDSNGDVTMAGTTWHWRMTVSATDVKSMQRIDIKVAPQTAGKDASIASVSGFYGTTISSNGDRVVWDPSATPGRNPNSGGQSSEASSSSSSSSSSASAP